MDHGGEAARSTTAGSADLGTARAIQGGEARMSTGTFHGQLSAAAARARRDGFDEFASHVYAAVGRGEVPVPVSHREPGPGVAYADVVASWRQPPGPVDVVLVGPQSPGVGGVMAVHDNYYGYSALHLQPRPSAGPGVVLADLLPGGLQSRSGAGRGDAGEVLVDLLPGGAAYDDYVYYALQHPPVAGHGEVLVDLLPDDAGHGELFVGLLPGGDLAAYDDYVYYALQHRPVAGHGDGEVLVDLLPDDAGHGELFVGLLPGGGGAVHDDYGYNPWQPRRGVGSGEVFIGPLLDGVGVVLDGLAQQTLPVTGRADRIAGVLRDPVVLADDHGGAVHNNRGMVLRRLLPFAGIGASSVAINGLAAGPISPAVALHLFVLFLGGLFLVVLHVLRV